jgi:hypothetical protein
MKQFDDQFRQQVADAFSSYNAGKLADAGWNSFVRKQKGGRRAGIIIPLWAKAASVAIILAVGSLFTYRALDRRTDIGLTESAKTEISPDTKPGAAREVLADVPAVTAIASDAGGERTERTLTAETIRKTESAIPADPGKTDISVIPDENLAVSPVKPEVSLISDSLAVKNQIKIAGDKDANLEEEDLPVVIDEPIIMEPDIAAERTKRTFLIAGFSGMMSVVNNMTSGSPGASLGIYTEHRITRRIAFRPGLVLAKNSLGVESSSATSASNFNYASPALSGATGVIDSYKATVELLAMEVPLNMVFTIIDGSKSSLFLSAGASTMIYINQQITGSFRNAYTKESLNTADGQTSYETRYSEVEIETEQEPFSNTDYFGLANFSAGYSLPFGKTNKLLIEPFVQLPISDLTSLNVRVKYGGVSMKLRFGAK